MGMLVEGWRSAYRWFSVQAAAVIAVSAELYQQLPMIREYVDPALFSHTMAVLGVVVILGRLKRQG